MALIVRTTIQGEGNSFAALAFADDYFGKRAILDWKGTDGVREAALVRATDYIDNRFGQRFTDEALVLEELPVNLQRACCEYALRALTAALAPDPQVDPSGVSVVTIRKKLGPLEKQLQVLGTGNPQILRAYPAADMLLRGLLKPTGNMVIR